MDIGWATVDALAAIHSKNIPLVVIAPAASMRRHVVEPYLGAAKKMARTHYAEGWTAALMQPPIDVAAKYGGFRTFPAQELIYAPPR